MRPPRGYLALLAIVAVAFGFVALHVGGVLTVENLFLLLVNYVFQVFAVTVLAALGGVFLGLVLGHRMLASRAFTPFERELLQALGHLRARLEALDARDRELRERLEGLEKRVR